MTSAQLTALGAIAPALPEAPANQVNLGWLRVFDTTLSWTYSNRVIDNYRGGIACDRAVEGPSFSCTRFLL
jgi:hypothetical protein